MAGDAGGAAGSRWARLEPLVWVVARHALERRRARRRALVARARPHPRRVGHDGHAPPALVDAGHGKQRLVRRERTAGAVRIRVLALAEHVDGCVKVALAADVEPEVDRQPLRVDDRRVRPVALRVVRQPGLDVDRARPVAPLAPDALRYLGEGILDAHDPLRDGVVARHAPVRHCPSKPRVRRPVAGRKVPPPAVLGVPRERELDEAVAATGEVGPRRVATPHDPVHRAHEAGHLGAVRVQLALLLGEPGVGLDHAVLEPGVRIHDRRLQ